MLGLSENNFAVPLVVNYWKLCNWMWSSSTFKCSSHFIFLCLPCHLLQSQFIWTDAFLLRDRLAIWLSLAVLNGKKWILHIFLLLPWVAPQSMEMTYVYFLEAGFFQHLIAEIPLLKLGCFNFTCTSSTQTLPSFHKCAPLRASFYSMTQTFLW